MLLEQHTQEVAHAVEASRRHVAEEPHDLIGVLEHFVEDMVELHSKNPNLQRVLIVTDGVSTDWEASSQQLAHGNVTSGGR